MNLFTFSGNLGKDVQVSQTNSGTTKASFSVAVKSGYGDNEKTSWIHCSIFGKRAEGGLIQYLKKGQQVIVSGEFTYQEWQDQQGNQRAMPSVLVDKIDLIGGRNDNQATQQQAPQQNYQQQAPQQQQGYQQPHQGNPVPSNDPDDDIPF